MHIRFKGRPSRNPKLVSRRLDGPFVFRDRSLSMKKTSFIYRLRSLIAAVPAAQRPADELRVCFVGDGTSGSWKMRAEQIASLRDSWDAIPTHRLRTCKIKDYDVICFVKRMNRDLAATARSMGKVVVYDIIDPWKQPDDERMNNTLPRIFSFFHRLLAGLSVDGIIFPNQMMCDDYGYLRPNSTVIYHHYRPNIKPIEVKRQAQIVGYEGRVDFLGHWRDAMSGLCESLGLRFVVNPSSMSNVDIGFAARSGKYGTRLSARYKSNVKLANMMGAGIPAVVNADEAAYQETDDGNVRFFRNREELRESLTALLPYEVRLRIQQSFLRHRERFSLANIVAQYEQYFQRLVDSLNDRGAGTSSTHNNTMIRSAA